MGSYVVNSNVKKCAICFKYLLRIMHPTTYFGALSKRDINNKENITRTSWQISRSSFSTFSRYSLAIASLRSEPSVFCSIEDITLHEERLKIKKKARKKNEIFVKTKIYFQIMHRWYQKQQNTVLL